jgi:hypothetical protein
MPYRLIPIFDSIVMTIVSFALMITFLSVLTVIPTLLAILYWMTKFKQQIQKNHNGSLLQWLKWLVKKN